MHHRPRIQIMKWLSHALRHRCCLLVALFVPKTLASDVLAKFGYRVGADDRLHGLLVQALAEGQSDAYIDALLNFAVTRGDFRAPVALTMSSGRLNMDALLQELVVQYNN